jgi:hypothetical protein
MSGIGVNKRSTVAYFKHEVTPGTVVTPTSATDGFLAVSADLASSFEKAVLDSDLLTASIGMKKGQAGMTTTGASLGVEMKGSAVEGTAPEYGNLLESLLGTKTIAATEIDVIAGSTTTVLALDVGDGASFSVGQAVLVKHAAHPWEVRVIKSILVDALTVEPALAFAPVATTMLGKVISYSPANSGHKHGTLGYYWGNEVSEKIGGCLVESLAVDVNVGAIVKGKFAVKGLNNTRVAGAAPFTPTYDASNGLVGLDVEAYMDGVKVDFPSLSVNIKDDIAELLSAKEVSGKVSSRASKRTVEVTMAQYVDSANMGNQTKLAAMTDFSFVLVAGQKSSGNWVAGTVLNIYLPRCYFTAAPYGDESDIVKEDLAFKAHIGTGLSEVFVNYL